MEAGLGEAIRVVPMRVRIVSYSPGPKAWPHRPTIHVEGEQGGPLGSSEIRHVHGTVGMTADGEIRYNLVGRLRSFCYYLAWVSSLTAFMGFFF
jgi:hypothetical protein